MILSIENQIPSIIHLVMILRTIQDVDVPIPIVTLTMQGSVQDIMR